MSKRKPNVLFLIADDLRPELGCYGQSHMHTPNIDALAARCVQFDRAYCQVPVCGASRASLFSSLRPTPQRFLTHYSELDKDAPGVTAMHEHLRAHGYTTAAVGKVLHVTEDREQGWTRPPRLTESTSYLFPDYRVPGNEKYAAPRGEPGARPGPRGPAWEVGDVDDDAYGDAGVVREALATLDDLAARDEPFFLATGFIRPHLPFIAPRKYWDLYDPADIELPDMRPPENCPPAALHQFGELRNYLNIPNEGPLDEQTVRSLIHGYRATISYVDALMGRMIDGLANSAAADNTIIVLCVDHGWNLGEHGMWSKHCLFETSLRVPLLIGGPGLSTGQARGLAENLDIYPTLCELLGLPTPEHVRGQSLVPMLRDPSATVKSAALSRWSSWHQGESVRTDRYRYSEFRRDGQVAAHMLYDHQSDPGETVNIADDPAHRDTVRELAALLPEMNEAASASSRGDG